MVTTLDIHVIDSISVRDVVTKARRFVKRIIDKFFVIDDKVVQEEEKGQDEGRSPPPLGIHVEEEVGTEESVGP